MAYRIEPPVLVDITQQIRDWQNEDPMLQSSRMTDLFWLSTVNRELGDVTGQLLALANAGDKGPRVNQAMRAAIVSLAAAAVCWIEDFDERQG